MYTNGKLTFLYSESLLHPGAGEGVGAIDLPIQRERITNWPIIQASGIKGAMRDYFEAKNCKNDELFIVFGPDPNKKDSNGLGNPADNAGAVSFSDAKVLLFPVRSLKGTFAYVTCPLAITRLKRDLEALKTVGPDMIDDNFKAASKIGLTEDNKILLPKNLETHLAITTSGDEKKVILEELAFSVEKSGKIDQLSEWLKNKWPSDFPWIDIENRLAMVSDDIFRDFVEFSTEVITRNRIDDETGTAQQGALWNEECLPRETLMYSLILAGKPLKIIKGCLETADNVIDYLAKKDGITPDRIWLGGDQTIGRGILRIHFV